MNSATDHLLQRASKRRAPVSTVMPPGYAGLERPGAGDKPTHPNSSSTQPNPALPPARVLNLRPNYFARSFMHYMSKGLGAAYKAHAPPSVPKSRRLVFPYLLDVARVVQDTIVADGYLNVPRVSQGYGMRGVSTIALSCVVLGLRNGRNS